MNINITGRKIELTQALRRHTEDKIKKALRFTDKVIDVHVIMSLEKYLHWVEMTFNLEGQTIFAKEASADMYSSIDQAIAKIVKQLQRYRERLKSHKIGLKRGSVEK